MASSDLTDERVIEILNKSFTKGYNASVEKLSSNGKKAKVVFLRSDQKTCFAMKFHLDESFCNGKIGIDPNIQGGFASAMLDEACGHAIVASSHLQEAVTTLEQKVSFLNPIAPNRDIVATVSILRRGKRMAFLEAELKYDNHESPVLAKASQTILISKLVRKAKL